MRHRLGSSKPRNARRGSDRGSPSASAGPRPAGDARPDGNSAFNSGIFADRTGGVGSPTGIDAGRNGNFVVRTQELSSRRTRLAGAPAIDAPPARKFPLDPGKLAAGTGNPADTRGPRGHHQGDAAPKAAATAPLAASRGNRHPAVRSQATVTADDSGIQQATTQRAGSFGPKPLSGRRAAPLTDHPAASARRARGGALAKRGYGRSLRAWGPASDPSATFRSSSSPPESGLLLGVDFVPKRAEAAGSYPCPRRFRSHASFSSRWRLPELPLTIRSQFSALIRAAGVAYRTRRSSRGLTFSV